MRDVFARFSPDPNALLRLVSKHVNESMLNEIAAADYGDKVAEHLAPLRQIRDGRSLRAPMRWEPREVLELIRWSEPDIPDWKPGSSGERGHWMRAFCCSALL